MDSMKVFNLFRSLIITIDLQSYDWLSGEVGDVLLSEATGEHEYISPHSRAMRQSMKRMDRGIKKLIMTANAVATDIYD